jgi:hypothetical protein
VDFMTDVHWQTAVALSRLENGQPADRDQLARRLTDGAVDLRRVERMVMNSKATRLAARKLSDMELEGPAGRLRDRIREFEDREGEWRQRALPQMRRAVEEASSCGGRLIKGLAVQSLYPEPDMRHVGDVDVQFPSWTGAMRLARRLRSCGWVWDVTEFPWLKWDDGAVLYGQISLVLPTAEDPVARVDLHIGPFSVGHAALMPMTGWRAGAALGVPAQVPDVETFVALIAAHAVNDGLLSMKDINDIHVLVSDSDVDWASTTELCRSVEATGALAECLAQTAHAYPQDPLPRLGSPGPTVLRPVAYDSRSRARRFSRHAYRNERHRGASSSHALRRALTARRYFGADLRPRVRQDADNRLPPQLRRRDVCWRLLPVSVWGSMCGGVFSSAATHQEGLADGLDLVTGRRGGVVVLGGDVFIPTVWGDVSPEALSIARSLGTGRP